MRRITLEDGLNEIQERVDLFEANTPAEVGVMLEGLESALEALNYD